MIINKIISSVSPSNKIKKRKQRDDDTSFTNIIEDNAAREAKEDIAINRIESINYDINANSNIIAIEHGIRSANLLLDKLDSLRNAILNNDISEERIEDLKIFLNFVKNIKTDSDRVNIIINDCSIRAAVELIKLGEYQN